MTLPTDPYNFTNGSTADAEQVDARFAALFAALSAGGLDAAALASEAWTAHTPTLTGVAGSSNVLSQRYVKLGRTVVLQGQLTLGTGGSLTADPTIQIPHAASATPQKQLGVAQGYVSTSNIYPSGFCVVESVDTGVLRVRLAKGGYSSTLGFTVSSVPAALGITEPWTWVPGDLMRWAITYEAAS